MNIEKAKKLLKVKIEVEKSYNKGICDSDYLSQDSQAIEVVLNELEKKDKIIDKMVEFADSVCAEDEICKKIPSYYCEYENCEECIKQYFEKEIENEN